MNNPSIIFTAPITSALTSFYIEKENHYMHHLIMEYKHLQFHSSFVMMLASLLIIINSLKFKMSEFKL